MSSNNKYVARLCQLLSETDVEGVVDFTMFPVNPFTVEEEARVRQFLDRAFTWAKLQDSLEGKKQRAVNSHFAEDSSSCLSVEQSGEMEL